MRTSQGTYMGGYLASMEFIQLELRFGDDLLLVYELLNGGRNAGDHR